MASTQTSLRQPTPPDTNQTKGTALWPAALSPEIAHTLGRLLLSLASPEPEPEPPPLPSFMAVDGYAEHLGISAWKVRQLCTLGLPHSRLPGGRKLIRIHVAEADAWIKAQGGRL